MTFITLLGLIFPALAVSQPRLPFDWSLPCLISPMTQARVGDTLEFQLFNSLNSTCKATWNFADPILLPLSFTVQPRNCAGDQTASLKIPYNFPNGTVAMQWQCSGTHITSCVLLNLTGGIGNNRELLDEWHSMVPQVNCRNSLDIFQAPVGALPTPTKFPIPTVICS